jgi:hypothetical protein
LAVTTATAEGGATPEMSDGFDGVDGTEGVEGVLETGGAELEPLPPPQAATKAVNRTKGRARMRRSETIAEPPRSELAHACTTFVRLLNSVNQRQRVAALEGA